MEKRTISLDINQAKEMYQMGGVYKTLALFAYTEEELNPKKFYITWDEFFKNEMIGKSVYYIDDNSIIKEKIVEKSENYNHYKNSHLSVTNAFAHSALMQLHIWRDHYNNGWLPEMDTESEAFVIESIKGDLKITRYSPYERRINRFLTFKDEEVAFKFLHGFKNLIMKARYLI